MAVLKNSYTTEIDVHITVVILIMFSKMRMFVAAVAEKNISTACLGVDTAERLQYNHVVALIRTQRCW